MEMKCINVVCCAQQKKKKQYLPIEKNYHQFDVTILGGCIHFQTQNFSVHQKQNETYYTKQI